jgi:hypothetical protein
MNYCFASPYFQPDTILEISALGLATAGFWNPKRRKAQITLTLEAVRKQQKYCKAIRKIWFNC